MVALCSKNLKERAVADSDGSIAKTGMARPKFAGAAHTARSTSDLRGLLSKAHGSDGRPCAEVITRFLENILRGVLRRLTLLNG